MSVKYANKNGAMQKNLENKTMAIKIKHQKITKKTNWNKIKNKKTWKMLQQKWITKKIKRKQLDWYKHLLKMNTKKNVNKYWNKKKKKVDRTDCKDKIK